MSYSEQKIIAMTGATGFIGGQLTEFLEAEGWEVRPIGRKELTTGQEERLNQLISNAHVIINLAGAPIITRWTETYKEEIRSSRIDNTIRLTTAMAKAKNKPKLFISTSAVGIYSDTGTHTEDDYTISDSFLGKLAQDWEAAALKAQPLGIRTIIFRFGVVLGREGGALNKMLIPFKLGLGGTIASGKQPCSWVHIEDLMRAYLTAINSDAYTGTYNLTSPGPCTNKEFTRALAKALKRPAIFPIPAIILKAILGQGADAIIGGQRVIPKRLTQSGFTFKHTDIYEAIKDCLKK